MKYSKKINFDILVDGQDKEQVRTVKVSRTDLEGWLIDMKVMNDERKDCRSQYNLLSKELNDQLPKGVYLRLKFHEKFRFPYNLTQDLETYLWGNKEQTVELELSDLAIIKGYIDSAPHTYDPKEMLEQHRQTYLDNIAAVQSIRETYGQDVDIDKLLYDAYDYSYSRPTPVEFLELKEKEAKRKQQGTSTKKSSKCNKKKELIVGICAVVLSAIAFCIF